MVIFSVVQADWWENSVTKDLSDSNFQEFIGSSKHVVLEFYAPFCHWCKIMFKEYEEVSIHYNDPASAWKNENILIARVNSQFNPKIIEKYKIFSFPTIVFIPAFSDGVAAVFNAPRMKFKFIEWIEDNYKKSDGVEDNFNHELHEVLTNDEEHTDKIVDDEKNHKDYEKNHEENGKNDEENENHEEHNDKNVEFMQFEMIIEDVSSHASEK